MLPTALPCHPQPIININVFLFSKKKVQTPSFLTPFSSYIIPLTFLLPFALFTLLLSFSLSPLIGCLLLSVILQSDFFIRLNISELPYDVHNIPDSSGPDASDTALTVH